jgi:hypothetical protein
VQAQTLGAAGTFSVLGGSTVTNTGATILIGDLGVNPGSAIVGFPPGSVTGTSTREQMRQGSRLMRPR